MLLEVLLGGSDELDGGELEAAVLEAGDDGTNEAALGVFVSICFVDIGEYPAVHRLQNNSVVGPLAIDNCEEQ